MNAPGLIPVQFQDGSYAVMFFEGYPLTCYGPEGEDLTQAITHSSKMPVVSTLATGIVHITVSDQNGREGHIRYHYGMGKEDREDYIEWS